MNKTALAVAVAGALGALAAPTAQAQTSTVQIGGSITLFYYSHDPNNPNSSSPFGSATNFGSQGGRRTDILETSEPEMFIRGEEALGGGLSVWFQCTSSLDGMVTGAATARGICGRNSGIGFKGSWGNVFAGNWDTPEKLVFNRARGWWGGTNSLTGGTAILLQGVGGSGVGNPQQTITGVVTTVAGVTTAQFLTTNSNNAGEFFRRQAQLWSYHSPVWSGFSFKAAYTGANEGTGFPEGTTIKPRMWSLGLDYDNGPLYLGFGYERHKDFNPGNLTTFPTFFAAGPPVAVAAGGGCSAAGVGTSCYLGGNDTNWILVAGYTFANTVSIRGIYSRLKYDLSAGNSVKSTGWGLFADWTIAGPHTLRGMYVKAGDTKGTSLVSVGGTGYKATATSGCGALSTSSCATGTGAKLWGIAYSYAFSKRTEGSLVYSKMDNNTNGTFSRGKVAATAGASQSSAGLVLKHSF